MAPEYLLRKTPYTAACDVYSFGRLLGFVLPLPSLSSLISSLSCLILGLIIYEIYSRKIPYEGEHPTKVLHKVVDPRINYRPTVPGTCPKRMAEVMKKCWSSNASFRPEARDLDMKFADMIANDAEPLIDMGTTRLRTEVAAGDMLYKVFPRKVADQLKAGQKVEPYVLLLFRFC